MKTCLLFSALLSGPNVYSDTTGVADPPAATTPSTGSVVTLRLSDDSAAKKESGESSLATRDELRTVYRDLLIQTSRRKKPDPYKFSESLVALHRAIADCRKMSNKEKKRMQRSVEGRLEQFLVLLKRDVRRTKKTTAAKRVQTPSSIRQPPADKSASHSGGAGVARCAAELINLIQVTIAPESWDVNGGEGSIMFYSRLNVLVIRNTSEVHRSIGSGLSALR